LPKAETMTGAANERCKRVLVPVEQRGIAQPVRHVAAAVDGEPADASALIAGEPGAIAADYL
jgi:hypothetical protein